MSCIVYVGLNTSLNMSMLNLYPANESYFVNGSVNDTSDAYSAASIPYASNKCVKSSANALFDASHVSALMPSTAPNDDVDADDDDASAPARASTAPPRRRRAAPPRTA